MSTLQQQWESFVAVVIAKDAPDVQRKEMHLAFFAGAASLISLQMSIPDGTSDEDGARLMAGWHIECVKFAAEYGAGQKE